MMWSATPTGASVGSVAASLPPQVEKPLPLAESTVLFDGQGRNRKQVPVRVCGLL